jgi:glycoprotein endo-alpha-1,2-mannosidase
VLLLAACNLPIEEPSTPTPPATVTIPALVTPTVTVTSPAPVTPLPPVEGPDPSDKVAAFYYSWYGNPATDGEWIHWTQESYLPPKDIASDYFPDLGAYSSNDPGIVAQHMA